MQNVPKRIRRCRNCGNKTHHKFWEEDKVCPICGSNKGYSESTHGGLVEREIKKQRETLSTIQKRQGGW